MKTISLALIITVISLVGCVSNSTNPTPPEDYIAPKIPFTEKIHNPDHDPYFHETSMIHGTQGPVSITRNIIQDTEGVFWFATWEGIVSFDGEQYTNYTNKDDLRRFHMFSAYQDRKGGYWFGSVRAGLYRYDKKNWENITSETVLTDDIVSCFMEDSQGNLWIGTSKGAVRYNGETYEQFSEDQGLVRGDVNDIVEDKDGVLWFGTRDELYTFKDGKFNIFDKVEGKSLYNVRTIIRDKEDRLWFGGNSGLWVFDGDKKEQIMKDFVGFLYEDDEGNVYAGVANGSGRNWNLVQIESTAEPKVEFISKKILEQEGQIFGIMKGKDGVLRYGTERGVVVISK